MSNGKKNGRIPVVSAIIGALCIILYIGALSYGALNIYNNVTERRALGDREFDNLADLASAAGVLGFMDERFIQTIQDAIDRSETILGVVISGSKGEFAFERERGTVISWVNNSPRFVPRFAVTRPPKYLPLRIEGQRNVNIQAVSGYLDYGFCIETLKRTLLIILFSLTLAFFTLLMDALLTKNAAKSGETAPASPGNRAANSAGGSSGGAAKDSATGSPGGPVPGSPALYSPVKEKGTPEAKKASPAPREEPKRPEEAKETEPEETGEEEMSGEEQTGWNTEDFDFEDEDDFPYLEDEEISESRFPGTGETETQAAGPQGLFSPRGDVGWESYVGERLESELHRSASTEQDLILIVMAFKEPEKLNDEQFRCFAEEAIHRFGHRDLIFEYGEQGLWVIHPNCSLEQGLAVSEEFNTRILTKLPRPAPSRIDLRLGISSRSGRLINAEQIMMEAREAFKRAVEDPSSHVVAFKSDPEKYRRYISGRNPRSA
ncbi:MAG: hypothetical protein LBB77_01760 [Treponema sp.]|jgi:hypothetical protein|nr:hypothetical protein [Treponema sp.]